MKLFFASAAIFAAACHHNVGPYQYLPPDADASYETPTDAGLPAPDPSVGGACAAYCAHLRVFPTCVVEVPGGLPCEDLCAQLVAQGSDPRFACVASSTTAAEAAACCAPGARGCSRSCAP